MQRAFGGSAMSSVNSCKIYINVALPSETHLKPHERFFTPNYQFYRTRRFPGRKGRTSVAMRKYIPHNHVDLPPHVSIEATGVSIPIGNSEVLLAAVMHGMIQTSLNYNDLDISHYWQKI
jgi:hypothetical protein